MYAGLRAAEGGNSDVAFILLYPSVRTEPLQPSTHAPAPIPAPAPPQTGASADSLKDHGPRRVTCDVQWSQLHRADSGYENFIRDCMMIGPH
jgi:hypothetical protein